MGLECMVVCMTMEDAIEGILCVFSDCISDSEEMELRDNLKNSGYHSFNNPGEAGAQYAEISESNGPMPYA